MNLEKRIIAFTQLGKVLREEAAEHAGSRLSGAIQKAIASNRWFTEENIRLAIGSLANMLEEDKLRKWTSAYPGLQSQIQNLRSIGVIMAGNIPLVGFHDFLCVLISGNEFRGKLASDDQYLLPAVAEILCGIEPEFRPRINLLSAPIKKADAFIATGSNNSARYFDYYFAKYPHIIRRNRNAAAILDGTESQSDLKKLGQDIFQYFGMGCRNVSKLYIPRDYNLDRFYAAIVDFGEVINHNKYYNNHIYYHTIYLLNKEKFLDNNFLMLKEDERISSPVATLYYERYNKLEELFKKLEQQKEQIQCVVTHIKSQISNLKSIPFGQTQMPELWDYADGMDTMEFLLNLP